jgi:hypothetical protein
MQNYFSIPAASNGVCEKQGIDQIIAFAWYFNPQHRGKHLIKALQQYLIKESQQSS